MAVGHALLTLRPLCLPRRTVPVTVLVFAQHFGHLRFRDHVLFDLTGDLAVKHRRNIRIITDDDHHRRHVFLPRAGSLDLLVALFPLRREPARSALALLAPHAGRLKLIGRKQACTLWNRTFRSLVLRKCASQPGWEFDHAVMLGPAVPSFIEIDRVVSCGLAVPAVPQDVVGNTREK